MLGRPARFAAPTPPSRSRAQGDATAVTTRLSVVSIVLSLVTLVLWLLFWSSSSSSDLVWLALLPAGVLLNGIGLMMALVALQKSRLLPQPEPRTLARAATGLALVPLVGSTLFVGLTLAFG